MMQSSETPLDLTVFVPCYNERANVCGALDTIQKAVAGLGLAYEVLIYDDASSDDSAAVIEGYISQHATPEIFELIRNETNRGIGANFFRAAQRGRGRYLLVVNGDDPIAAADHHSILVLLGKADLILTYFGTSVLSGPHNFDYRGWQRRVISVTFSSLVRLLSGMRVRFFNGVILWRRDLVVAHACEASGSGYSAELLCRILSDPAITFLEVKIHNHDRPGQKTTAFRAKNVVSVLGSLTRILAHRLRRGRGR